MKSILNLQKPIIGLAPMDGVTDSSYRYIMKKYGNPDLIFTEFTNVMGMCIAGDNVMHTFHYDEVQRPIVGQIYGKEPEYFYHAAKIICALGFDAVDINMGCPARTVASSGSGAGLIRTPELAKEIVAAVREGINHWVENGELTGLSDRSLKGVEELQEIKRLEIRNQKQIKDVSKGLNNLLIQLKINSDSETRDARLPIPVSIKTRIGYDVPITETWINHLNEADPEWITVHGRTLRQMYSGQADWNEIKIAVEAAKSPVLANGDIQTPEDVDKVLNITNAAGVLIGRGSYGNPWIFRTIKEQLTMNNNGSVETDLRTRVQVMIEHTKKFVEIYPEPKLFFQMRKHFGWYIKGFDGASEVRKELMTATKLEDVEEILKRFKLI